MEEQESLLDNSSDSLLEQESLFEQESRLEQESLLDNNIDSPPSAKKLKPNSKWRRIWRKWGKSKWYEYLYVKVPLGGGMGMLFGHAYYNLTFAGAFGADDAYVERWVFWTTVLTTGAGCALSMQIRCIFLLSLVAIGGKTGRSFINTLLMTWILAGPISSILLHSSEGIRSFSCLVRVQAAQTGELKDLLKKPVMGGLNNVIKQAARLDDEEEEMVGKFEGMEEDLWQNHTEFEDVEVEEDEEDGDKRDLARKISVEAERNCKGLFLHGVNECVKAFKYTERKCMEAIKIPILKHVLCFVMKVTFLCDTIRHFNFWCSDMPEVDAHSVNSNNEKMVNLTGELHTEFDAKLSYQIPVRTESTRQLTPDEMADQLEHELAEKQVYFDFFVTLFQKSASIMFVFVFQGAAAYNHKYLTDFRFDNLYITKYFKRKDMERRQQGKQYLLPLRQLENHGVIHPLAWKLQRSEFKAITFKVIKLFGQCFYTTLIILFGEFLHFLFSLIRKHGEVETRASGHHKLEVIIGGNGTVAALLRNIFHPYINNTMEINSIHSNSHCLPTTPQLPRWEIHRIYWTYLILLISVFGDGYMMRLRHAVAGWFYQKRERKRIVYLYDELLRNRKNYLKHVIIEIKKMAGKHRLNQRYSLSQAVRIKYPCIGKWLAWFNIGNMKCLICDGSQELQRCKNEKCRMDYCRLCWIEVGAVCWACKYYEEAKREILRQEQVRKLEEWRKKEVARKLREAEFNAHGA